MEEFIRHGYEKASTNRIVKKAGIGKGMLFYYFQSKEGLYYYLLDYGLDFIEREYVDRLPEQGSDFIERYKKAAQVKLEGYIKNRYVFNFLGSITLNREVKLQKEYSDRLEELQKRAREKLYSHIDTSFFREDIESDKIFRLLRWTIEGYQNEVMENLKGKDLSSVDFDSLWKEFYELLAVLRKLVYKDEGVCDESDGN